MKIKVTIERVISQTFEVEVSSIENAYDEIRKKYKDNELPVNSPALIQANCMISDEHGDGDWMDLHI